MNHSPAKTFLFRFLSKCLRLTCVFAFFHFHLCIMPHAEYTNEPKIDTSVTHGDWRDDLYRDGYYVVKGVLPEAKAQSYVDRMFQWLETFPYGFKKDDPSTWNQQHLPDHIKYATSSLYID